MNFNEEIFDNVNEPKKFLVIPNIGHDYRHNDSEVKILNEKIADALGVLLDDLMR